MLTTINDNLNSYLLWFTIKIKKDFFYHLTSFIFNSFTCALLLFKIKKAYTLLRFLNGSSSKIFMKSFFF